MSIRHPFPRRATECVPLGPGGGLNVAMASAPKPMGPKKLTQTIKSQGG